MSVNTPGEIVESYVDLLIYEYGNLPNATGTVAAVVTPAIQPQTTVQSISFSAAPISGNFTLSYAGTNTSSLAYTSTASSVQTALQAISGLSQATVSGSLASLSLVVTFTGVPPIADLLIVYSNTLMSSSGSVAISIVQIDQTLPVAVMNAFNFQPGTTLAVGVQLDIIGKYVGVTRTGYGFTSGTVPITLDDADFISLIQMAIIRNQNGSSLFDIVNLIYQYFGTQILVYDNANMSMNYFISAEAASSDLVQLFVGEGLLPAPMGVLINTFYIPTDNVFKMRTYAAPAMGGVPLNSYQNPQSSWRSLSYQDLI